MRILLLNQAFYPDVIATAQLAADLALALQRRGHDVSVISNRTAYDDPSLEFSAEETWNGIHIYRVRNSGLGKGAKWRRGTDYATFLLACAGRVLSLPRFEVLLTLTLPPFISVLADLLMYVKGGKLVIWCMDLNPDEAIAAGWLRADSLLGRGLMRVHNHSLGRAAAIVALDRFMKQRLVSKGVAPENVSVLPPWAQDCVHFDPDGREKFRRQHGLADKFVVMYAGNHSICHPLDTLLDAAENLSDHPEISFCFLGGGTEFRRLQQHAGKNGLRNILCVPYQPVENLAAALSAADLHVVVMGNAFTGIVHPSKIYNILRIGAPFLYIGPAQSHIVDIISHSNGATAGRIAAHGDVDSVRDHILAAYSQPHVPGADWDGEVGARFFQEPLVQRLVDLLESVV
jgi:colanic acid biosynthesis glycosyl transferase WcaI